MARPKNIICAAIVAAIIIPMAALPGGAGVSKKQLAENNSVAAKLHVKAQAPAAIPGGPFIQAQTLTQYLATDRLLGAVVHNSEDKLIGDIEDLIVSQKHRVIGVIIGIGGALGFGEKKIGVAIAALEMRRVKGKIHITLALTSDALKNAPAFKRSIPVKSLIQRGAEATKSVLKKAAEKTTRTVTKAKEVTKKIVAPVKSAKPVAKN